MEIKSFKDEFGHDLTIAELVSGFTEDTKTGSIKAFDGRHIMTREDWIDRGASEDALFLTESMYDNAIAGVSYDGRIVYDIDKVITSIMEVDGMTEDDAIEYAEFNIFGAYMGEMTPIFIYT